MAPRQINAFITNMESDDDYSENHNIDPRELARKERLRQLELASAGQKSLRNRIVTKKSRTKDEVLGNKRHLQAMKELDRRRVEKSNRVIKPQGGVQLAKKGISSGIKTNNKYMSEFNNIKRGFERRKGKFYI